MFFRSLFLHFLWVGNLWQNHGTASTATEAFLPCSCIGIPVSNERRETGFISLYPDWWTCMKHYTTVTRTSIWLVLGFNKWLNEWMDGFVNTCLITLPDNTSCPLQSFVQIRTTINRYSASAECCELSVNVCIVVFVSWILCHGHVTYKYSSI